MEFNKKQMDDIMNSPDSKFVESIVSTIFRAKGVEEGSKILIGLLLGSTNCLLSEADPDTKRKIIETFNIYLESEGLK